MDSYETQSWEQVARENYLIISTFILLVTCILRFYNLGGNSLWLDEAIFANIPLTDFWSVIEYTRYKNSTPILLPYLYYLLGEGLRDPFLIRLPPAIFSVLSVGVILALPKAGVPRNVAILAALMLAIAPVQVFYAQEVREYSLSVLMSCFLIFSFSGLIYRRKKTWLFLYLGVLLFSPLTSYGVVFMALATVVTFTLISLNSFEVKLSSLLLPWLALLSGITISYHLTASNQMYVTDSWYLASFLPPEGMLEKIPWVTSTALGWLGLSIENQRALSAPVSLMLGGAIALLISVHVILTLIRTKRFNYVHMNLFLVLIILMSGAIVASLMRVYPFGGIRQHLYAAPLITLCVSQSLVSMATKTKGRYSVITLLIGILLIATVSFTYLPRQYREIQDIVSALSSISDEVDDRSVYIYYMANTAVEFHFPDRKFFRGTRARYQVDVMGEEIIEQIRDCHVSVVFTHVWRTEDTDIIGYLEDAGLKLVKENRYAGARVLDFTSCGM